MYPANVSGSPPTNTTHREPWITTSGVYPDVTPEQYLRDPVVGGSVTSSILRMMTPPEFTPAHARHYMDCGREPKGYYDVGSAYHVAVLGRGGEVVSTVATDWKLPATRAWRDEQYALGKIPLLLKDVKAVAAMYAATLRHPDCSRIFAPGSFDPEVVVVWRDEATGLMCRAMIDAVPHYDRHMLLVDLKGLAVDTSLPTPTGWTTMRAVQVGDEVFDSAGRPCRVTAKSDVHWRPCYRVRFDDGSSVICDDEHRWLTTAGTMTKRYRWERTEVRSTEEIRRTLRHPSSGQRQHRITLAGSLDMPDVDLPIDPYVLGCWLGDGSTGGGIITSADPEVFERIAACGYGIGPNLVHPHHQKAESRTEMRSVYGLHRQLRLLGLLGYKVVPDVYLRASARQRLDLLRGLMDTDGTWNTGRRQAVFSNTERKLSEAVRELACSLGQRAVLGRMAQRGYGVTVESYPVSWRPVGGVVPFALERKASGARTVITPGESGRRMVVAVEEVPTVPTQCIEVDSPDHTYLCTESMIPTHNTKIGNADPASVSTSLARYGYHQQFAHYIAGVRALGLAEMVTPLLVVCGKDAPYVPLARPVDDEAISIGQVCNRKALDLYATCTATGNWPGYDDPENPDRAPIGLPGWKRYQHRAHAEAGVFDVHDMEEVF